MKEKESKKNRKPKNWGMVALKVLCFLIVFALVLLTAFVIYRMIGKAGLEKHARELRATHQAGIQSLQSRLNESFPEEEELVLAEGQIAYQGKIYEYNDDILTFLCLGVDSRQDIKKEKIPGEGGQADTVILVVLNQKDNTLKLLNISRDTMTKIKLYDTAGLYLYEEDAQLALQYAYGDGRERSCELMEQAVSYLFYGIPIHGYAAIDIRAVSELNDAVGGVEVTVIEDLSRFTPDLALGNTLTLTGRQALHYVQERQVETEETGSNNLRIERQKQYVLAFFAKVKQETKKDITLPVSLFQTASKHMITSVTADQAAYLSTIALECSFSDEDMISVPGTVEQGELYEEFYIDEQAFFDLLIDVFYREVEQ